jgi:hypothetical protein
VIITEKDGKDVGAMIAYNSATGAREWVRRPKYGIASVNGIVASPDGKQVFITGCAEVGPPASQEEYVTAAYNAATGKPQWLRHYADRARLACAHAIALSPAGAIVYVTGASGNSFFGTLAYGARTGRQIWLQRYVKVGRDIESAQAIAVSANGSVYVTGTDANHDYLTIGYSG